METYIEGP